MNADLDTLATALYVTIDDDLAAHPEWAPRRPAVGIAPRLADAELLTLAVLQALLGFTSEARWIRYAKTHLGGLFPYIPARAGYNKRLRAATETMRQVIACLTRRTPSFDDDVWLVDSTPVECGRSRETAKRCWRASELAIEGRQNSRLASVRSRGLGRASRCCDRSGSDR